MRINFRTQIIVTMVLVIVGFISSLWFAKDMYYNLAWAFTGIVFFINPVYPYKYNKFRTRKSEKGNTNSRNDFGFYRINKWIWCINPKL